MSAQRDVSNIAGVNWQLDGLMLQVKFAKISLTTSAAIVAAVTGKKIRVLGYAMTLDSTTGNESYQFSGDTAGTPVALSGTMIPTAVAAPATPVLFRDSSPFGLFESAVGTSLGLTTAGTTPIAAGYLQYVEVPA